MSRLVPGAAATLFLLVVAGLPPPARAASDCAPAAEEALTRLAADWRAGEFEAAAADARAAYALAPACVELGTASWAGSGWNAAASASVAGGSADSLAQAREALAVLESTESAGNVGRSYAAALVHAAAAAAQHEREELRVWLEHAEGLGRRLTAGQRPWPLPFDVAEGELWITVEDYDLAQAAFERALAAAPTPVAMRGLARARARRGDVASACAPFARALDLVPDRPDGTVAREARAFLRLCP
jgi:tetratricopeptide (TPR) repeat protein